MHVLGGQTTNKYRKTRATRRSLSLIGGSRRGRGAACSGRRVFPKAEVYSLGRIPPPRYVSEAQKIRAGSIPGN